MGLEPLRPALPLSSVLDALRDSVRAALEARGGVVEAVAHGFAQTACRAGDGVAYAAARCAGDAADRAG